MPVLGKGGCCSYKTILGTKGKASVDKFVRKRFLEANGETTGYITGIQLANMYVSG